MEVSVTGGVLQACRQRGDGVLEARCRCADVEATNPELCVLGTLYAGGDAPCGGACVQAGGRGRWVLFTGAEVLEMPEAGARAGS